MASWISIGIVSNAEFGIFETNILITMGSNSTKYQVLTVYSFNLDKPTNWIAICMFGTFHFIIFE